LALLVLASHQLLAALLLLTSLTHTAASLRSLASVAWLYVLFWQHDLTLAAEPACTVQPLAALAPLSPPSAQAGATNSEIAADIRAAHKEVIAFIETSLLKINIAHEKP
jgi:hypothetical protein